MSVINNYIQYSIRFSLHVSTDDPPPQAVPIVLLRTENEIAIHLKPL